MTVSPALIPVATSGNPLIDAMLETREVLSVNQAQRATVVGHSAYNWGGGGGTPVTLRYSFISPGASFAPGYSSGHIADIRTVPDNVKAVFRTALQLWSNVANVTFQEIDESSGDVGEIRIGVTGSNPNIPPGSAGFETFPPAYYDVSGAGDIWMAPEAAVQW